MVSGTVFTPTGAAPTGGWTVVAYGHGTTPIDEPCALSLSDSLLGQDAAVEKFTAMGYSVALADYQGLGADGVHLYLDSRTAGDFAPTTPAAAQRLRDLLRQWALPQNPLSAPLTVECGRADTYIDQEWTRAAIQRACLMGGTVVPGFEPEKGHSQGDSDYEFSWIAARFTGTPVVHGCSWHRPGKPKSTFQSSPRAGSTAV